MLLNSAKLIGCPVLSLHLGGPIGRVTGEIVDPNDVEMLEDLILTAFTEGIQKADSIVEAEMGKYNVPGGLNGLF